MELVLVRGSSLYKGTAGSEQIVGRAGLPGALGMTEIVRETESGMVGQHTEVSVRNLDLIHFEEL